MLAQVWQEFSFNNIIHHDTVNLASSNNKSPPSYTKDTYHQLRGQTFESCSQSLSTFSHSATRFLIFGEAKHLLSHFKSKWNQLRSFLYPFGLNIHSIINKARLNKFLDSYRVDWRFFGIFKCPH